MPEPVVQLQQQGISAYGTFIQGGQAQLQGYFETYIGSFVALTDVSGVSITITGADGTVAVNADSNVSDLSEGLWQYDWAIPVAATPQDYTAVWSGVSVTQGAIQRQATITVYASPPRGCYATLPQYRAFPPRDAYTPDDMVADYLVMASEAIDRAAIGAVYAHDANNMPSQPQVIEVFMRACCAQAQYMLALMDPANVKSQFTSTNVGGVALGRAPSVLALAEVQLAPRALTILHNEGVLGSAPLVGW